MTASFLPLGFVVWGHLKLGMTVIRFEIHPFSLEMSHYILW
jgi:hypothetical protein